VEEFLRRFSSHAISSAFHVDGAATGTVKGRRLFADFGWIAIQVAPETGEVTINTAP
jgi:hypothetical protein